MQSILMRGAMQIPVGGGRRILRRANRETLRSGLKVATSTLPSPPAPLAPLVLVPLDLLDATLELAATTDARDVKRLENLRVITNLLSGGRRVGGRRPQPEAL